MTRKLVEPSLVVASHNKGKVREIGELLAPFRKDAVSAGDLNLPEPDETEPTFIGNALIKSRSAARLSGLPALADDSGLCVDALGGDPGIYSARWAGATKDFNVAMAEVHRKMQASGSSLTTARFVCALAVSWPDGGDQTFEGTVEGNIVWPIRGAHGFGYDPMFVPTGYDVTFGEMDPAKKHAMSHRAKAFALFVEACLG
jgi:XTP/dITP diphosphohydrolase